MHLDPDFYHLTYGDRGQRAHRLETLRPGDKIVFYSGLRNLHREGELVYAIIGMLTVRRFMHVSEVARVDLDGNAHSRRIVRGGGSDLIAEGRRGSSGRLVRCIPIGDYRDGAYRVYKHLLKKWGGISTNDGYIQRSVYLPEICDPERFIRWFESQNPTLIRRNN